MFFRSALTKGKQKTKPKFGSKKKVVQHCILKKNGSFCCCCCCRTVLHFSQSETSWELTEMTHEGRTQCEERSDFSTVAFGAKKMVGEKLVDHQNVIKI